MDLVFLLYAIFFNIFQLTTTKNQAEDRVRRIGQTASRILSLWVAGFSLDDSLDAMLQKKDKNCETVICSGAAEL